MAGLNGFGVQLQRGDGAEPEVFAEIADITTLGGPGLTRETIDVTSHSSPDAWMEHIGGLKDGGEVTADINYQPAVHDILVEDFEDGTTRTYKIVFPDDPVTPTTWTFQAFLTGFEPEWPYDDKATASLTFKVSGKPVLA